MRHSQESIQYVLVNEIYTLIDRYINNGHLSVYCPTMKVDADYPDDYIISVQICNNTTVLELHKLIECLSMTYHVTFHVNAHNNLVMDIR